MQASECCRAGTALRVVVALRDHRSLHSSQQNTPKHPSTSGTRQPKQTYTSCMIADASATRSGDREEARKTRDRVRDSEEGESVAGTHRYQIRFDGYWYSHAPAPGHKCSIPHVWRRCGCALQRPSRRTIHGSVAPFSSLSTLDRRGPLSHGTYAAIARVPPGVGRAERADIFIRGTPRPRYDSLA